MFLTPYHTLTPSSGDAELRRKNEAKAFAFWQTLVSARDPFAALFRSARETLVFENGRPTALRLPDGREIGL